MRRSMVPVLSLALAFAALGSQASLAQPIPPVPTVASRDLVERGRDYDGKVLWFEGEAIGDPMARGDHAWVNLLDSSAALGAWLPRDLLPRIASYGSYRGKGDTVRVKGVFHRACPDHGGDMDIHAEDIVLVSRGGASPHVAATSTLVLAPLSLLAALGLFLLWRRREAALRKPLSLPEGGRRGGSLPRSP